MTKLKSLLFALPYVLAVAAGIWFYIIYPQLPNTVPLHWNSAGTPDRFADKSSMIYMLLLTFAIPLLCDILPKIDPRRKNYRYFADSYQKMKLGISVFMIFMFVLSINAAMSSEQKLSTRLMSLGLGILFMLIGNYLAKVKNNYFVGIKTPWTLASDEVWRKTHRLGGWLFFIAGLVTIICGLVLKGEQLFPIFLTVIMIAALVPMVYSYLIYRRLNP